MGAHKHDEIIHSSGLCIDCSQFPVFHEILDVDWWVWLSAILASGHKFTGESTKCPWVGLWRALLLYTTVLTPPPILTGILYSPYFCSHQETKMAASQTQQSQPTISRLYTGGCQVTRGHFKKWLKVITFGHKYWPAALSSKPCWWQI